jgi:hypothetical protein
MCALTLKITARSTYIRKKYSHAKDLNKNNNTFSSLLKKMLPYLGLHYAHPLLALKISRKKLVRVYNAHGLLKNIVVRNVRIKCQSYIFLIQHAQRDLAKNHPGPTSVKSRKCRRNKKKGWRWHREMSEKNRTQWFTIK